MKTATGSIRKKTQTRNGKDYTYWEARYTVGTDPVTGKQIQKTVTAKTRTEVRQKLTAAMASLDDGSYIEPSELTVGQWLQIWQRDYLLKVKPATAASYRRHIKNHIAPALGRIPLAKLNNLQIQSFYTGLYKTLSAKTVKDIHGVLHKALSKAVDAQVIRVNPADHCELARPEKPQIRPLDGPDIQKFMGAIRGHRFENLFTVILLLGLRQSEALGLTWDNIDFETGQVTIEKQLLPGSYELAPTKNSSIRTITASPTALSALQAEKMHQLTLRLAFGAGWDPQGLVFTGDDCGHLCHVTVFKAFKAIAVQIGRPDARLHDLRHSYAVMSLECGDNIKVVQEHLGHATAAFTLATYAHVSDQAQDASAARQEAYLRSLKNA